jgi:hypothetical protein
MRLMSANAGHARGLDAGLGDELVWVQTGGPHKSRNRAAHKERFVCAQTRITFLFSLRGHLQPRAAS